MSGSPTDGLPWYVKAPLYVVYKIWGLVQKIKK